MSHMSTLTESDTARVLGLSVPRGEQGRGQAHQAPADDQDGDLDFFVLPGHGLIVGLSLDIQPTELVNAEHC